MVPSAKTRVPNQRFREGQNLLGQGAGVTGCLTLGGAGSVHVMLGWVRVLVAQCHFKAAGIYSGKNPSIALHYLEICRC